MEKKEYAHIENWPPAPIHAKWNRTLCPHLCTKVLGLFNVMCPHLISIRIMEERINKEVFIHDYIALIYFKELRRYSTALKGKK